jgi:CTP synthase (UTP-ammonia lyase)
MAFYLNPNMEQFKIGVIGDFNFTYNTHHATNLAIDHAARFLDVEVSYYWLKVNDVLSMKAQQFSNYDGFWIAPGPFINPFFLNGVIDLLMQQNSPVFITGDGFKNLLEVLVVKYNLNSNGEKLISDNLIGGNLFERISINPQSKVIRQLYEVRSKDELASARYSMYPQLISALKSEVIDIEAINQFEDPEIISLKNHVFFVSCGFCPQISSTRELPHPLIYTFIRSCGIKQIAV